LDFDELFVDVVRELFFGFRTRDLRAEGRAREKERQQSESEGAAISVIE